MNQKPAREIDKIEERRSKVRQNLFYRLSTINGATRHQALKLLQHAGELSIFEWRVLWDLNDAGPMTISDLADIQGTDRSQLSRGLPAMRDKGLLTLERDSIDGRQVVVGITETGKTAYETTSPVMQKRRHALRAEFSPEDLAKLMSLLDQFEGFLRKPVDAILDQPED